MNRKKIYILSSSFILATHLAYASSYVVRKGNSLSKIAGQFLPGPVWGEHGSLEKVLAINPGIKNPSFILPGQTIELGGETLAANEAPQRSVAAEAPAIEQTNVTAPLAAVENGGYALVEITPKFFYTRIDGKESLNGTEGRLLSKLNFGLDFSMRHLWTEQVQSFVRLGVKHMDFNSAASRTLESSSFYSGSVEGGVRWLVGKDTALDFSIATGDEVFYHASSTTSIQVDSVMVPQASLGISQNLYTRKALSLGADLKFTALGTASTANYDLKSGWGYTGKLHIRQEPKNSNLVLTTGIFYGQSRQNTSLIDAQRSDIGVDLVFQWNFGK